MNEGTSIPSEQLARYLSGEADAAERLAVEAWAAAEPARAEELRAYRRVWELGGEALEVDVDRAWDQVHGRINEGRGRVLPIRAPMVWRWVAAAAVLAGLFVGVRSLLVQHPDRLMASNGYVRSVLQDSSSIVLSPGSRADVRMKDTRSVDLSGEAYFEVHRDEERPFVVQTSDVKVTVLGTAFEVSAFDTSASVLVRVRHGRVRVEVEGDSVILGAGGYARYNRTAHVLERLASPPAEVFGDRIIQFQEANMSAVVEHLQKLFPVRIELANERLRNCRLTATFEDEPIEYILRVIADTYGSKLTEVTPGSYVLDGEGC